MNIEGAARAELVAEAERAAEVGALSPKDVERFRKAGPTYEDYQFAQRIVEKMAAAVVDRSALANFVCAFGSIRSRRKWFSRLDEKAGAAIRLEDALGRLGGKRELVAQVSYAVDHGYLSPQVGEQLVQPEFTPNQARQLFDAEIKPPLERAIARTKDLRASTDRLRSRIPGLNRLEGVPPTDYDSADDWLGVLVKFNETAQEDRRIGGSEAELRAFYETYREWQAAVDEQKSLSGVAMLFGNHGIDVRKALGASGLSYVIRS